jgi:hypothetical protein
MAGAAGVGYAYYCTWPKIPRLQWYIEDVDSSAGLESSGLAGQADGVEAGVAVTVSLNARFSFEAALFRERRHTTVDII